MSFCNNHSKWISKSCKFLDVKKENPENKKMSIEIDVLKEESMDVHCTVCDKPFANHRYMVQHRYQVHWKEKLQCVECGVVKASVNGIEKHIAQYHTKISCILCNAPFTSRAYLKKHKDAKHRKKPNRKTGKACLCPICDKLFSDKSNRNKHLKKCK